MSRPDFSHSTVLNKRYEIILLFDVHHGNPNGDPDAENAPRIDPETGVGLVTDVAIKRKIRNYVGLTQGFESPNNIYVKERGILANEQRSAYRALQIEPDGKSVDIARAWMCKHYFDVRTFGAVMTTGRVEIESDTAIVHGKKARGQTRLWNCGQVRGPVQFGFATSIDPVTTLAHTITRVALTNPSDAGDVAVVDEHGEEKAVSGQMGRKYGVAYGLYRLHGFVSPFLAKQTMFMRQDMATLLNALTNLFDHDRSATRGEMSVQRLWLFEHKDQLGNAPANKVLDTVRIPSVPGARSFAEYEAGMVEPEEGMEVLPGVTAWRYV